MSSQVIPTGLKAVLADLPHNIKNLGSFAGRKVKELDMEKIVTFTQDNIVPIAIVGGSKVVTVAYDVSQAFFSSYLGDILGHVVTFGLILKGSSYVLPPHTKLIIQSPIQKISIHIPKKDPIANTVSTSTINKEERKDAQLSEHTSCFSIPEESQIEKAVQEDLQEDSISQLDSPGKSITDKKDD